jgi:hypothetical protein
MTLVALEVFGKLLLLRDRERYKVVLAGAKTLYLLPSSGCAQDESAVPPVYVHISLSSCLFSHITLNNFRPNDLDFLNRSILSSSLDQTQSLHNPHARLDPAEDRMFVVQPWRWCQRDEELTSICIWSTISHAENTRASVLESG